MKVSNKEIRLEKLARKPMLIGSHGGTSEVTTVVIGHSLPYRRHTQTLGKLLPWEKMPVLSENCLVLSFAAQKMERNLMYR